jgi:hypothetical protein
MVDLMMFFTFLSPPGERFCYLNDKIMSYLIYQILISVLIDNFWQQSPINCKFFKKRQNPTGALCVPSGRVLRVAIHPQAIGSVSS